MAAKSKNAPALTVSVGPHSSALFTATFPSNIFNDDGSLLGLYAEPTFPLSIVIQFARQFDIERGLILVVGKNLDQVHIIRGFRLLFKLGYSTVQDDKSVFFDIVHVYILVGN